VGKKRQEGGSTFETVIWYSLIKPKADSLTGFPDISVSIENLDMNQTRVIGSRPSLIKPTPVEGPAHSDVTFDNKPARVRVLVTELSRLA